MTQPIPVRTATAPLSTPQTSTWSANWAAATPQAPAAPQAQPQAALKLGGDVAQGMDGARTIRETAQGGPQPALPQYELATPPKVDPPKAVVPSVSLSGSTQNRLDTLIGVQQGQIDAIAAGLSAMGFTIDPKKTSRGLTPTQEFYSELVGVLMGVEASVKETEAYKTLHKLYVSMPSQLSKKQLADLTHAMDLMTAFPETVQAVTELRLKINAAKEEKNQAEVEWWESRIAIVERDQRNRVSELVAELQRLDYTIDPKKTSSGLTDTQQFYADLTGVFVGAEEGVKEIDAYKTLHELYMSMPNELSDRQLANLGGVKTRLAAFAKSVKTINEHRVELAQAKADKKEADVKRLEGQIASETERQRAEVQGMVRELQRLNYQIDPSKIDLGLTPTQKFYAALTGVLAGVEAEVKESEDYKTLHKLYMSMPKELSERQLAELKPVMERLEKFPKTVSAITTLRIRINEAKAEKKPEDVKKYEAQIQQLVAAERSGVSAMVADLQRLNYTIDESKTDLGLTPTHAFYADLVGVLQGAEAGAKETDAYKRLHELYLSMPKELSERQLADLEGVKDRMKRFAETVKAINDLRVDINHAREAKDDDSVARYERQIAELTERQRTELWGMVADLQGLNYQVDPNKTDLGLTKTQRFYAQIVGVLMGVEDGVKESEDYKTLHQLYASMPSELSDKQLGDLAQAVKLMEKFPETVKAVTELRVKINEAKVDKKPGEVKRLESEIANVERDQRQAVSALVAELKRLNYTIDESKTSPGLTGAQTFYNDLSGMLTLAEDEVKKTDSFKRLAQLYASMPSQLSDSQLQALRGLWAQIRGFDPISDQINGLRVQLAKERAEAKGTTL